MPESGARIATARRRVRTRAPTRSTIKPQTEACFNAVVSAQPPQRPVVRHTCPTLFAACDEAESVVERDAGLHLRSSEYPLRLGLDDLDAEPIALRGGDASNLVEHGPQDCHRPICCDTARGSSARIPDSRSARPHRRVIPLTFPAPNLPTHAPASSSLRG